jgi:hypothetical protein
MPRGKAQPAEERFWNNIDKNGRINESIPEYKHLSQCWSWVGAKNRYGYGVFGVDGKIIGAHRFSFWLHNPSFDINDTKLCVLHKCDNPECCEHAHLFLGSMGDNMRDKEEKGRGRQPKGEKNGRAKLTETQIREIREKYENEKKITYQKIADEYGVTQTTIGDIINNKRWNHIK